MLLSHVHIHHHVVIRRVSPFDICKHSLLVHMDEHPSFDCIPDSGALYLGAPGTPRRHRKVLQSCRRCRDARVPRALPDRVSLRRDSRPRTKTSVANAAPSSPPADNAVMRQGSRRTPIRLAAARTAPNSDRAPRRQNRRPGADANHCGPHRCPAAYCRRRRGTRGHVIASYGRSYRAFRIS